METGTLVEFAGSYDIEKELAKIKAKSSVESDLARLKAEEGNDHQDMGEGQYEVSSATSTI